MKIQLLHPNAQLPTRGTEHAGGFDIYMPENGAAYEGQIIKVGLGFAAEVPPGHVALMLPRSSSGGMGLELANTSGVIDPDYRGQWFAKLTVKRDVLRDRAFIPWKTGERVLQFVIVACITPELELVESVAVTDRGTGGFGSTGS